MENMNWTAMLVAAIIPTITGFIWYHPKVLGTAWMHAAGLTEEKLKGANMVLILGLSLFLSFLLSMTMNGAVIHQYGYFQTILGAPGMEDPNSELGRHMKYFTDNFGTAHRNFKHGILHGIMVGLMFALPLVAINAMFERKSSKYIFINAGYWILTLALMGGLLCAWI